MKYRNSTNAVIMVPNAGELVAVAPGVEIDLLYAAAPGLVEVSPPKPAVKPKTKKPVEKKVNVEKQSKSQS